MSYVDPKIKKQFDSLSPELQDEILKRDVKLYSLKDLMDCLQKIVDEG